MNLDDHVDRLFWGAPGFTLRLAALAVLPALLWRAAAAPTQPVATVFKDRTAELGLAPAGDGVCWADFNQDGWTDLCAGGVIWQNRAGANFARVAEVGAGVAADFNNDGFTDFFSWSRLKVYRNDGGRAFVELKLPELPKCVSRGAVWGDFNGDGFADLYVGGYEDWDAGITYPDLILMNDRGAAFKLAWSEVRYRARGITACDFDRDGDLDVYVSNYRLQPNLLWLNDGTGQFKDAAAALNAVATSPGFAGGHSIGAAWGDFDNDGYLDLFAGNFAHVDSRGDQPKSRFLRNLGPAKNHAFQDLGACGVFYQESYASPAAGDYDNDGHLDLFFTTVYATASFNRPNHPVLLHNTGNFVFTDATAAANLAGLPPTYQAAWADFDNDGDLDL
jgi:enediyne biosynthesis protein E4